MFRLSGPALAGHFAMLLFSLLVAGSFALGALVANEIAPLALNALRFWIATAMVGAIAYGTGSVKPGDFKSPWRHLVLAGVFSIYFVLMFEGLKTAPSVSAAAVFTLTPILSAIFGYVLLRQVTTSRMALALGIGALGAIWVIFRADLAAIVGFDVGRGEMIYFWGCVSHAIYTPMVRKLNRGETALSFTFGTLLAGAMILSVIGMPDIIATDWAGLRPMVWVTILYTAVFSSAVTFTLLQFASLRLPSAKVMAYTYLTPCWVMVWDVILGGALPSAMIFIGIGLTVLALGLLLRE